MITDSIANFPLRAASDDDLAVALALCHREYLLWHGQAVSIARSPIDAQAGGVESVFVARNLEFLESGVTAGWIKPGDWQGNPVEIAAKTAAMQLEMVEYSARIAAVVMLHSACERNLWRFVRFAMVSQRDKAIKRVNNRQVTIQDLSALDREQLVDRHLEKWWGDLERDTILKKWDSLVDLLGNPEELRGNQWHFDREMLDEFDKVRHDCVHHSGSRLESFDLDRFASQLERSQWVWSLKVAMALNVKIPAEIVFGVQNQDSPPLDAQPHLPSELPPLS